MKRGGKDFEILAIVVVLCCIKGFVCANGCENHINIGEPRHSSSENKDTIYVLAIDEWFNSTKCTWKFSTKSDFLLNLFFLNYTSLVPAGSDCKICYYMVRVFDSSTNTSFVYGPYCGQKQRGIRVSGVITIELVAQRQQYISGLSLAILVEASSKECGGLVTKPKGAVAVSYDAAKFGITKNRFAHCVWYFELSSPMDLQLIVSQFTIYHDTYGRCDYYNDFLSIRSWDATDGRGRREILMCKKFDYKLPMIIHEAASDRFALILHYERYYGTKGKIESIAFIASPGQPHSAVAVEGNGKISYEELFNSTDSMEEESTVTALKPSRDEYQIFGVIDSDRIDCRFIHLEIWLINKDAFQIKFDSCNTTSQMKFITFNTQEMAILNVRAQKRHFANLKAFYFSSKKECGGLFDIQNSQNISIVSPRTISGSYPPNMDCQWTVLAPQTMNLQVLLAYMDIEDCYHSFYDYIELLQGFRTSLQLITKTCANTIKDFNITGDVTIRFVSDASQHNTGFTIIVTSTEDNNREMSSTTASVATTNSKTKLRTSTASSINKSRSSSIGARCCKTKGPQSKQQHPVSIGQKHTEKISKTSNKANTSATSEKLYAIGISFGVLALVLLVITAVLHFRRRDVNSKAPYVISNELYQSSASIDHERNDRNAKFEDIPMGNLYDYAQPKASFQEVQGNENTYDYPKSLGLVPVDNDIVYERMDSQTYQCCPRNTPIDEQYSYAASTHKEEKAFLESSQKLMKCADGKIRFGNGSIYDQPCRTDAAKTLMNDSSEADYSCVSNDQYIAPDQL